MAKRYCVADIHGNYAALIQVLKKAKFNYNKDTLIILGDIVDGYLGTKQILDELLKIKNTIFVMGNHDEFLLEFVDTGFLPFHWISQGGWNTLKSYDGSLGEEPKGRFTDNLDMTIYTSIIPNQHIEFLRKSQYYYELDGMLFVHGGFDYPKHPEDCDSYDLVWDRELLHRAKCGLKIKGWRKVFLGHTTSEREGSKPIIMDEHPGEGAKVIQMDCGAGWKGRLCLYDIDSDEYILSDYARDLNPGESGRG